MIEDHAREAGRACGVAGTSDVVDAAVVVLGLARDDRVVTSDEDDLRVPGQADAPNSYVRLC
jgi:hypothetical protein